MCGWGLHACIYSSLVLASSPASVAGFHVIVYNTILSLTCPFMHDYIENTNMELCYGVTQHFWTLALVQLIAVAVIILLRPCWNVVCRPAVRVVAVAVAVAVAVGCLCVGRKCE
jgi:hypothetical protein